MCKIWIHLHIPVSWKGEGRFIRRPTLKIEDNPSELPRSNVLIFFNALASNQADTTGITKPLICVESVHKKQSNIGSFLLLWSQPIRSDRIKKTFKIIGDIISHLQKEEYQYGIPDKCTIFRSFSIPYLFPCFLHSL